LADILFPGAAASATRPSNPAADVERIAKAARIPFSVAFALAEAAGAQDPAQQAEVAQRLADTFGPRIAAGEDFRDILRAEIGREADTLLQRADQIAQERYPDLWAKKQAKLAEQQGGFGSALKSGVDTVQQAYGSAVEGIGRTIGAEGMQEYGRQTADVNRGQAQDAGAGLKTVDDIGGAGDVPGFVAEQLGVSAPQMAASMAGAATGAAIGSVVPIIGTGVGALIGGVAVNLPFFYGMNRERQKDAIEQGIGTEVSEGAAALTAIPQAALDTIVDKMFLGMGPTPAFMKTGGLLTRGAKGAAGGTIVEIPTEIGQSVLERMQAGLPIADDEAIKEYRDVGIAAGLLGGTVGGVSNAAQRPKGQMRTALDNGTAPPSQPQLVSPTEGGTIFADGPVGPAPRDPTEFERAPGSQRAPQGPMGAASTMAPPPIFEGATEGLPVTLTGADMDPVEGAFVKETPLAVTVQTADGEIWEIPRAEFESGAVEMAPTRPPEPIPVEDRPIVEEGTPPVITEVDPAGLAATAAAAIRRPPVKAKRPERPEAPEMSGDDAKERIAFLNDQGKTNGFTPAIVAERDSLQPVVDKADGVITKKDGSPFGDEAAAKRALNKQKLDPEGYDIEARGNGFVARPKKAGGEIGSGEVPSNVAAVEEGPVLAAEPVLGQADQAPAVDAPEMAPVGKGPQAPVPAPVDPQITATPMAPAAVRSQPDMLGGDPVPEEAMAAKERRKREWGQLLGIAESGKSDWDGEIEGRPVRVRRTRVRVLVGPKPGDQDMTLDTEGMSKEDIAGWLRDTLRRMPPMAGQDQEPIKKLAKAKAPESQEKPEEPPAKSDADQKPVKKPAEDDPEPQAAQTPPMVSPAPMGDDFDANMTDTMIAVRQAIREKKPVSESGGQVRIGGQTITADEYVAQLANVEREDAFTKDIRSAIDDKIAAAPLTPAETPPAAGPVTVEDIRARAAILRGVPKDQPPTIQGVPAGALKWEDKEGGFVFSRKHVDAVRKAMGLEQAAAQEPTPPVEPGSTPPAQPEPEPDAPLSQDDLGAIFDEQVAAIQGDAPPATEPPAAPVAEPPPPPKDAAKKAAKAKASAERKAHTAIVTSIEAQMAATVSDVDGFADNVNPIIVVAINEIAAEYGGPEKDAIMSLVADGKPVLPRSFYETAYDAAKAAEKQRREAESRDPQVLDDAVRLAATEASATGTDAEAQFQAGFLHAVAGGTKSTLPQDGRAVDGYTAARNWIKTAAGKAWFAGKTRGKKAENTGDVLRRVWEINRKGIDGITAGDMKKAWAGLLKATARADWFPVMLAPDATPGAREFMDKLRAAVSTFQDYYPQIMIYSKNSKRRRGRSTAEDVFMGNHTSYQGLIADRKKKPDDTKSMSYKMDDDERLALSKEVATRYGEELSKLAERFAGLKTLAEIKEVVTAMWGGSPPFKFKTGDMFQDALYDDYGALTRIMPPTPGSWDAKYATWARLEASEAQARPEKERKDPLVRPRLDKIVRKGEDKRGGKPVSAAELKKIFGLADVTIGEYVTAAEATDHLNYAHDAFMTLASLLGIKPEQVGFGGELHLAIGALGHGKHAATYHHDHPLADGRRVSAINLTKTRGDGALLHEYFHAIDFMSQDAALKKVIQGVKKALAAFSRDPAEIEGLARQFLTGERSMTRMGRATPWEHAEYGIGTYYRYRATQDTSFYKSAKVLDGPREGTADAYWSNQAELFARASEAWGYDELIAAGLQDDYLVSDWVTEGKVAPPTHRGTPYPIGADRSRFADLFRRLVRGMDWSDGRPKLRADSDLADTPILDTRPWTEEIDAVMKRMPELAREEARRKDALKKLQDGAKLDAVSAALFGPKADGTNPALAAAADEGFPAIWWEAEPRRRSVISILMAAIPQDDRTTVSADWFAAKGDADAQIAVIDAALHKYGLNNHLSPAGQERFAQPEPEPAAEPEADAPIEGVPLSESELGDIFDEQVALSQESTQEEPDAPEPGDPLREMGWTREDVQEILSKIEDGQIILLAQQLPGIPTIHGVKGANHLGFGVFNVTTPEYEGTFDAGSAMSATAGGKSFTAFSLKRGSPPWWNRGEVESSLRGMLGKGGPAKAALPDLDTEAAKTAAQLAKDFAAHGVAGVEESLTALVKLLGGGANRLQSFPGGFDEETYQAALPHLRKAADEFKKAGLSFKEFAKVFFGALVRQFGVGFKPYAVRFAMDYQKTYEAEPSKDSQDPEPVAATATPEAVLSDWVLGQLREGESFTWQALFKEADRAWGGTQANGTYTPKDAYDAVELAINKKMIEDGAPDPRLSLAQAREAMAAAEAVLKLVPTQTKRTPEMDEFQQFSTPPHFAYLAAWSANIGAKDSVLEPSAGIGGLAVFGKIAGAKSVVVNELSARRLSMLQNLPFDGYYGENAEHLDDILPPDVSPSVILMNPPFSATAGRIEGQRDTMNGAKHIEQALKRLRPGGRLVAIVGAGMAADRPAFKAWWRKIGETYNIRANIGLDGTTYAKYGTTFDNQILVIDKTGPTAQDVVTATGLHPSAALPLLEGLRNDRPATVEPDPKVADGAMGGKGPGQGGLGSKPGNDQSGADPSGGLGGGATGGRSGGRSGGSGVGGRSGNRTGAGGGRAGVASEPGRPGNTGAADPDGRRNAAGDSGGNGGAASGVTGEVKVSSAEEALGGQISNSTFEPYTPKRLRIEGAVKHNTPLVESAAMASISPPEPTYSPNLPAKVIKDGLLSDAQLEAVVYAGQAHQQFISGGDVRRGFFIGDGTGVGKGREISGIILDNMRSGRKKAVWLSKKKELMADAKRDFGDIGGNPDMIFSQANAKIGDKITQADGILFAGYSTLRGTSTAARAAAKEAKAAERWHTGEDKKKQTGPVYERVNQIVNWLGADFDGVIVFDEAHEMGNAVSIKGKRGQSKPSDQALAGLALQRALPKARVVYVSATGATEVNNLAYAERLGLWGLGTPFKSVMEFINEMSQSVSAMELVAQNLKQMGLYLARSLSFDGITYDRVEHRLSDYQRETYDLLATGWQTVLNNMDAAMKDTGLTDDEGKNNGKSAKSIKSAIRSAFWGSHQRFFNQIITASQMPTILDAVEADLAAGKSVLLQLTNTNAAGQDRALAKATTTTDADGNEEVEELDLTPRDTLISLVEKVFPTTLYEQIKDEDGNPEIRMVMDKDGKPVQSKEALARKAALIENIKGIRIPDSPLQMLIDRFGPDNVAEITGRQQRVIFDDKGKFKIEKRGAAAVAADGKAFIDLKKRVLVFSQAGGTGFSFHSDRRFKNQQQRVHYIMQAGWSADKAVQGLGRSNRTNQANQPTYRLVMTDIPAHKRFISSIARRLEQLGALTTGQRDTAGGSLFSASDNLESQYATASVRKFFEGVTGSARSITDMPEDLLKQMGLEALVDQTGAMNETAVPSVTQFLNRLLSLRLDTQEKVFEAFAGLMEQQVTIAKGLGMFDDGMKSIRHVGAREAARQEVYRDDSTNVAVTYSKVEYDTPNTIYDFADAQAVADSAGSARNGLFKNKKSGRVLVIAETRMTRTNKEGKVEKLYWVMRTSGRELVPAPDLNITNLERIQEDEAAALWGAENEKRPKVHTHELHMLTGGILPVWDRIVSGHVEVARIALDDGRRLIGRELADKTREETLRNLNVQSPFAKMTGQAVLDEVKKGNTVLLSNQWRIRPVVVSNDKRVEIVMATRGGFMSPAAEAMLKNAGVIFERISWETRLFVPIERGEVLDNVMKGIRANPVAVETPDADGDVMESRIPGRGDPVASLTGQELGAAADILALGKAASDWYRDNLRGQTVTNAATGWKVRFTKAGQGKIAGGKGEDLYRLVPALREIVASGILIGTEPDSQGRRQITAIHTFAATVDLDGVTKDVTIKVREAQDGRMFYDLNRDMSDGARFSLPSSPVMEAGARGEVPTVRAEYSAVDPALEGGPVNLNIEFREPAGKREDAPQGRGEVEADAPITDAAIASITRDLNAELARSGLAGKASVRVVKGLTNAAGINVQGLAAGSAIRVNLYAPAGVLGTMRHEIIHVTRNAALWGKPYGLYTADEWRGLVRAARADKAIEARVDSLYKDRSEAVRTEEKVAELYREWAAKRDQTGPVAATLRKIMGFLEAMANALRGRGFQSAARTMERIARGDVGRRGPEGGGARDSAGRFVGTWAEGMEARVSARDIIGFRRDNPGGKWLQSKIEAVEDRARASTGGAGRKFFNGAITGYLKEPVQFPVEALAGLKGAENETRKPGDPQFDRLMKDVKKRGFLQDQDGNAVLVGVNHKGQAYLLEGNTRVAVAKAVGERTIRTEIRWFNGGEDVDGPFTPQKAADMAGSMEDAAELRMPDVPYATNEAEFDAKERSIISNILTDLMGGKSPRYNLLGLVPGRALFAELGKNLPGAQRYLRLKEDMDAMRSDWHGKTDEVAQAWRKIMSGNMDANRSLMDLMHEATREGVDPSQPFVAPKRRPGMTPDEHTTQVAKVKTAWNSLKAKFDALPPEFKAMFNTVRDTYDDMATAFEKAVLDNATKAMSIGLERAERRYNDDLAAIRDEGLTGGAKAEAEDAAKKRLATAKKTHGWNKNARISQLRQQFESNRLDGPYFPLQRFGSYFVTVRDVDGKVVSFSRFESEKKQRAFAAEQRRVVGQDVQAGVMEDNTAGLRDQVDPNFVADIEKIIGDTIKDPAVMDMVWQRWLETLPDFSVRKSRIHRKGTPGFDGDAFRAFGRQVFHGSHQLARLTYAMDMQKALEDARREAAATSDPNRNGLIVNEMDRRHQFTMNPTGGAVAQAVTSAAFVYYLGVTPAAALVNISQTTVIGIPVLANAFDRGGIGRAAKALSGAMRDFVAGRGAVQGASRLTADEQAAMDEAYRRGTVDKSQAHDLAGVSESGVEYSARWMRIMKPIAYLFHHAERLNREVTFLAAYRMAKDNGFDHAGAIQKAADLTWKTHFDYQNTSRPRLMQNDTAKVLLVFRNFQINMLWRLFRDTHQMLHGRSEADRREARAQMIGISAMMMAHAGVKGVWGYALLTTLVGLLVPGGSDEVEEEIKSAIVNTFGPGAGGLLLNGVPGHITGIDLTSRLGMPELWFRKSDRQLEGDDEYNYFLQEMVGAAPGIVENVWRGTNLALDGEIWRGVETASPKFVRDLMKGYRYFDEGVTTIKGDPLLDDLPAGDSFLQALGFTPAQVSERYEINTRLKNAEKRITDERRSILSDATSAIRDGAQIPLKTMDAINAFNAANPDYPITGDTIKRSLRARMRASEEMEGGIRINPRIDQRLRDGAAPAIYQ